MNSDVEFKRCSPEQAQILSRIPQSPESKEETQAQALWPTSCFESLTEAWK